VEILYLEDLDLQLVQSGRAARARAQQQAAERVGPAGARSVAAPSQPSAQSSGQQKPASSQPGAGKVDAGPKDKKKAGSKRK
jgi:hypothetical protein